MTGFTLINRILTCPINEKLYGAVLRALDFFFFFNIKYFFFMSQHLILKCFLYSAGFRDRHMHVYTQKHFQDTA